MDDRRLVQRAGLVLPAAVWVLGLVSPPRDGLSVGYVATFTLLLAATALVDQTAPSNTAPVWVRLAWLLVEVVLCSQVVRVQGSLIRPALIYLLPVGRAILLFGERAGLLASLLVWLAYAINILPGAWPDNLGDFPNYFSFFLAPYAVAVILSLAIVRQERARHHIQGLYDELRVAYQDLRALHEEARVAAVAEEPNRLAREIHDSLAHYLTVANVQLEAAVKLGVDHPGPAFQHVQRGRRLILDCLQDVRRSVAALRAATLEELALERALQRLVAEFSQATGLRVQLTIGLPRDLALAPEVAHAVHRAAQEGLTNVHRHARASTVNVTLRGSIEGVTLAIEDDGIGVASWNDRGEPSMGYGLIGLRERVALLDGQVSFGPAEGGGSRLSVYLPLQSTRTAAARTA
jgi:signal transduction histidine kinase